MKHSTSLLLTWFISFLLTALPAQAHIGSPGVLLERTAGKYQVMISITPPDVVPGTAQITVWVERGNVRSIKARPVYFKAGDEGSPVYDDLAAATNRQDQFEGMVWLMDVGATSIDLRINGADGQAQIIVPMVSLATARRTMPMSTGILLTVLGIMLVAILITIVRVCSSESMVPLGQAPPDFFRRNKRIATGIALCVVALVLTGGRFWWDSRARDYYKNTYYQPPTITASVRQSKTAHQLMISFDSVSNRRHAIPLSFLIPDHGELIHLFLIQTPNSKVFAHLHPNRIDTTHFQAALPPLPAGRYRLYADVVYRNGFTETLTDTVDLPGLAPHNTDQLDDDDSWLVDPENQPTALPRLDASMARCGVPAARIVLDDGSTMLWTDKPSATLEAGRLYQLRFAVADTEGRPAALEPYLGMQGHAVVAQTDGPVFTHLHPVGTYSMAAEASMIQRIADTTRTFEYPDARQFRDSIDRYMATLEAMPDAERERLLAEGMPDMSHETGEGPHLNMVEFPYQFPQPGTYRIWVQVKRKGKVLTGVFNTIVEIN